MNSNYIGKNHSKGALFQAAEGHFSRCILLQMKAVPYFTGQTHTAEFWLAVTFIHVPENLRLKENYWQGRFFAFVSSSRSVFPQRNVHQALGPGPWSKPGSLVKATQLTETYS